MSPVLQIDFSAKILSNNFDNICFFSRNSEHKNILISFPPYVVFDALQFYFPPYFSDLLQLYPQGPKLYRVIDHTRVSSNQPNDTVSLYLVPGINFSSGTRVPCIIPFSLLILRLYRC